MKYSAINPPRQCFMRQSTWYKNTGFVDVKGVLWHSTGANNPELRRYIQPDDNAPDRELWLEKLGKNQYGNDWNHIDIQSGVHAFIGKLANGTVATVQVGDWGKKAWGCGSGWRGSCNNGFVQFEICEDGLNDPVYFREVYREGCELTAYICKLCNINPTADVAFAGTKIPTILCHHDSYKYGLGTGHVDVDHWFPKFGKSMETVRKDVATLLSGGDPWKKEDDEVTRWQTIDDVPPSPQQAYYKKMIQHFIDIGVYAGKGKDSKGRIILDITEDMLRNDCCAERLAKLYARK